MCHLKGRAEDGRTEYEACVTLAPESFEAHANFAMFLHQSGYAEDARREFEVKLAPLKLGFECEFSYEIYGWVRRLEPN